MLSSLRFRLPALFLAGIVVAGIVSTLIAFQLLQNYSHNQSLAGLRRDARGLSQLYISLGDRNSDGWLRQPAFRDVRGHRVATSRRWIRSPSASP